MILFSYRQSLLAGPIERPTQPIGFCIGRFPNLLSIRKLESGSFKKSHLLLTIELGRIEKTVELKQLSSALASSTPSQSRDASGFMGRRRDC